ncbi:MAG: TonB-dependent siderophore receptor [Verrucomicrobiota bacterium]
MNMLLFARASARRSLPPALPVLALLTLLPAGPLAAQTAAPAAPATKDDEVVILSPFTVTADSADRYRAAEAISAVRVRAPLLDTPSTISVITRDMMDDLAPSRVFDVTRYIAGVQEGRGLQFQDRMIIRGFETQFGARTVDNFLQPSDADNIEESVIDRIEVTKGPNAILSPSGAPGGSLNIITKSPTFKRQRSLTATVGLYDAQKYTLDVAGPLGSGGKFAYRLIQAGQDTDRYWDDSYLRGNTLAPMFAWRISDKTLLTAKLVAAEHWISREPLLILDPRVTAATDEPFLAPGINPKTNNGIQPWSHVETHTADFFTQLTTTLSENISLRVAANGRYYYEDSDQNFLSTPSLSNRYNPYTGELTQDSTWALANTALPHNATTNPYVATVSPFFNPGNIPNRGDRQDTRRRTANFQSDIVFNHQLGNISSQAVAGFAYARQLAYGRGRNGTMPGIDLSQPNRAAYPVYSPNFSFFNRNSYTNMQAYVNQRLGFLDNRFYVTGGLLRFDTKTVSRNVLTGAAPGVLDDAKNMWSLSALYKVRDNVSVYYNRSINASPVIANNQPLWRSGEQDELGFKTEFFGGKLSFNGAYFEISQTNVTVPNPAYQTDQTVPQQLVSDLGNKGYEFELMGSLTPNLSAIATWSHLKMRDSLGRKVRGVADDNASLLLNYRLADGRLKGLSTYLGVNYSGRRAGDIPDGNFTQLGVVKQVSFYLQPQYVTVLGFAYRWNERYHTRLVIDNVLDDKHHISVAGGRVTGTGITTQPGRNLRLTTTLNW